MDFGAANVRTWQMIMDLTTSINIVLHVGNITEEISGWSESAGLVLNGTVGSALDDQSGFRIGDR
jgi:hypothetical protein